MGKRFLGFAILVATMLTLLLARHYTLLQNPDNYYIGTGIDGFKNYYTPLYHVKYDTHWHHFDGMNYPYGEHVTFTDNQPILSNLIKLMGGADAPVKGIFNVLMLFSLVLCAVFIYLIFRKLGVSMWFAILVSVGIAFLSPQWMRFDIHYALAYTFVVPMLLYLTLCLEEKPRWWGAILLGILIIGLAQIHFYYFGIAVFFLGFYTLATLFRVWFRKINSQQPINLSDIPTVAEKLKQSLWEVTLLLLKVGIPFVFLQFYWLKLDNSVLDRPSAPSGFLEYRAVWQNIFLSPNTFFQDFLNKILGDTLKWTEFESIVYVGAVAAIFFFYTFLNEVMRRKMQLFPLTIDYPIFLKKAFFAAFCLFLLALGFPFLIPKLDFLLRYTGPLQQFRGVGRFAWVWYYVLNIVAFYAIFQQFQAVRANNFKFTLFKKIPVSNTWGRISTYFIVGLLIGLLCDEAYFYQKKEYTLTTQEAFEKEIDNNKDWLKLVDTSKFQAILPIPYYHVGSENWELNAIGATVQHTLLPSLLTGMPCMGEYMSRTSVTQSYQSNQFANEAINGYDILDHLPNQKPLLVIVDKEALSQSAQKYKQWTDGLTPFFENKTLQFYELPIALLRERPAQAKQKIMQALDTTRIFQHSDPSSSLGFGSTDSLHTYAYLSYDDKVAEKTYRGNGAYTGVSDQTNIIFKSAIPNQQKGRKYKICFWQYVGADQYPKTEIFIRELNKTTGAQLQYIHWGLRYHVKAMDKDWALFEVPFEAWNDDSEFEMNVTHKTMFGKPLWIDELLIRPENTHLYQISEKEVFKDLRCIK
jgi:hypothetical protein